VDNYPSPYVALNALPQKGNKNQKNPASKEPGFSDNPLTCHVGDIDESSFLKDQ
jgi:hypothetical protein